MAKKKRHRRIEVHEKMPVDEEQSMKNLTELWKNSIEKGVVLNVQELSAIARRKGWAVPSLGKLRTIRNSSISTAQFNTPRKPKVHISSSVLQPGNCFCDLAHFHGNLKSFNGGFSYFLAAVGNGYEQL